MRNNETRYRFSCMYFINNKILTKLQNLVRTLRYIYEILVIITAQVTRNRKLHHNIIVRKTTGKAL
jgi:hypothetical protein